jgi:hypothetical protein
MPRESYAQSQLPARGRDAVPYPDYKTLVDGLLLRTSEARSGGVTGTGAAIDVTLDFDPAVVILINRTAPCLVIKLPGMATSSSLKAVTAGTLSFAASTCTLGAVGENKFTIGTDADINTVAEEIEWVAFGFSPKDGD